jgi:hypothetical protein
MTKWVVTSSKTCVSGQHLRNPISLQLLWGQGDEDVRLREPFPAPEDLGAPFLGAKLAVWQA